MTPRAWITGVGVVSPLGVGAQATLDAIARGERAARPPSVFDASGFRQTQGGEVREFDARPYFRAPKALKLTDRAARFAVTAASLALAAADLDPHSIDGDRLGVIVGSSGSDLQAPALGAAMAGMTPDEVEEIDVFSRKILDGVSPLWLLINLPNMASAHVAIQFAARGPNSTVMSDWAAGLQAIGEGAEWIRGGEADVVLAGGSDSGLMPFAYASFEQAGFFAAPEPFVPGEGAAVFVLEGGPGGEARGARPLAEIKGYASAAAGDDPQSIGGALAAAMCDAAAEAEWDPSRMATLIVSGLGSPIGAAAARALEIAFVQRAGTARPITFEPWLGHALAAAAPIDLALALMSRPRMGMPLLCGAVAPTGQAVALAVECVG